jgi:tetratricopeptide (TPR) repeat protein
MEANMKANALKTLCLLAIAVLLSTSAAFSQAGRGTGRIGGVVKDAQGKLIEGAKLTLAFSQNENLKFDTTSNKKGEWSFIGLGTGNFELAVTATGFALFSKNVYVSQLEVNPRIIVELQVPQKATGGGSIRDEAVLQLIDQGNQLFKDEKYDAALAVFQEFRDKNPGVYQILISIGDCYREKGDYEKAVAAYNDALQGASMDAAMGKEMSAKALSGIGNCYLKQNKLQEAQDFFKKSIENSPKDEILAFNVGEIYFSNQSMDDALRYFELASQIKPEWPDPYLKMGYVFLNKGDMAKAAEKFEKFLTVEPEGERAALARNILKTIKK